MRARPFFLYAELFFFMGGGGGFSHTIYITNREHVALYCSLHLLLLRLLSEDQTATGCTALPSLFLSSSSPITAVVLVLTHSVC